MGKAAAAPEQADAGKPALPRRKLGKTGVEVSVLALGGMFDTSIINCYSGRPSTGA